MFFALIIPKYFHPPEYCLISNNKITMTNITRTRTMQDI